MQANVISAHHLSLVLAGALALVGASGCSGADHPFGGPYGGSAGGVPGPNGGNNDGTGNGNGGGDDGGTVTNTGDDSGTNPPPPSTKDAGGNPPPSTKDAGGNPPPPPPQSPTWSAIYKAYLGSGTTGRCNSCHSQCSSASKSYSWLQGRGYISGANSPLVDSNQSCLSWYGGNMPPSGPGSYSAAQKDMDAWAAAGAANN